MTTTTEWITRSDKVNRLVWSAIIGIGLAGIGGMIIFFFAFHYPALERACVERGGDRFIIAKSSVTCWRADGTRVFLD